MSEIGRMVWSISHDMRHSLTAIYANAEFLERHDICASVRAELRFLSGNSVCDRQARRIPALPLENGRSYESTNAV
jgi:hypothetical protein